MLIDRIASLRHQIEDHAAPAGGQIEFGRCALGTLSAPAVAGLGISGIIQDNLKPPGIARANFVSSKKIKYLLFMVRNWLARLVL
ncbi:hypothetical protein [Rhizobium leguminosarum]|uniref:hypothetical protein n=1 Tax=Rhizobium leguminosarum TaxID=384 RepID=UPI001C969ECA|nr:hypothetical protein [Rhizobium leguminosarum]MBY5415367.1 hypothetical protein [Rhizobium leguminosarum]